VAGELIAGLRVVFAVFAEDMGAAGKERDDSSGLCYYGARYLAPWLTRWISPDSMGAVDGLNLYIYVGNKTFNFVVSFIQNIGAITLFIFFE
jgi:RHS repeat-associated protein